MHAVQFSYYWFVKVHYQSPKRYDATQIFKRCSKHHKFHFDCCTTSYQTFCAKYTIHKTDPNMIYIQKKIFPVHNMKPHMGSRGIAPLILNPGTRCARCFDYWEGQSQFGCCGEEKILTFWRRIFFSNFSTSYI